MGTAENDLRAANYQVQLEADRSGEVVCRDFQQIWHRDEPGGSITNVELKEITERGPILTASDGNEREAFGDEFEARMDYYRYNTRQFDFTLCASPVRRPSNLQFFYAPPYMNGFRSASLFPRYNMPSYSLMSQPSHNRGSSAPSLMGDELHNFGDSFQAWSTSMELAYPYLAPNPQ
jgi:hypothetical protein